MFIVYFLLGLVTLMLFVVAVREICRCLMLDLENHRSYCLVVI